MITSWHIQRQLGWMRGLLAQWKPRWVKIVNPGEGADPYPEVARKLVRLWHDDAQGQYIAQGREGGKQWVRDFLPRFRLYPWATAFETANEPGCNSPADLANLREYSIGAMQEANANGLKLCILNLPEGNPGADQGLVSDAARASERWKLEQLAEAVKLAANTGHYVGLHGYWLPPHYGPLDRWHSLGRIEWDVEQWLSMGVGAGLRVLVNETGIDGLIEDRAPFKGWRSLAGLGMESYAEQVKQFEAQARTLWWLDGAMLFTAGFEPPWKNYDHQEGDLRAILGRLTELGGYAMVQPPLAIPYYHSSRQGSPIQYVILHGTEGSASAVEAWFRSPANTGKSSAHKIVCSDGRVIDVVPDDLAAHHAGYGTIPGVSVNINRVTLGLELEYPVTPLSPPWPEAQLASAAKVVKSWCERYGIPRERVLLHKTVDPIRKSDPRNWDEKAFLDRIWPSKLPLPEDEQGPPPLLAEKARWWSEEMQRQFQAGDLARAEKIRLSLITLLYQLECSLKEK